MVRKDRGGGRVRFLSLLEFATELVDLRLLTFNDWLEVVDAVFAALPVCDSRATHDR